MGTAGGEKKKGGCGKIILIVVIILVVLGLIGGITTVVMCYVCAGAIGGGGGDVTVGTPHTVTIWATTGNMQAGGSERPCVENNLTIDTAGMYLFTMQSVGDGDPFVSVWRDGAEVGFDDDSGEGGSGLNARLEQQLEAGTYQVRSCTYSASSEGTIFTLNVTQMGGTAPAAGGEAPAAGGEAPAAGGEAPAAGAGGGTPCDAYARCCSAYANSLSKVQGVPAAAIDSTKQSCTQIEALKTSPAADTACTQALNGMKQAANAYKAMPGFTMPAECQ